MVYDCFQFFNELDILDLRLHILSDVVDRFVISESTVTFSGDPKPLFYEENRELFREFKDRIIHVVVDDTPMDCDAYARDHHQKCAVMRGLTEAKPEDIIIFSDVDEIPDPETLRELLPAVEDGRIYMLAQRLFYCFLNLEDVSGKNLSTTGEFEGAEPKRWLGTKICRKRLLSQYTTEQLRDREQQAIGVRVDRGGWHFSYMGGGKDQSVEDRVRYKIRSAAHQNYNNRRTLFEVGSNLRSKKDILGRDSELVVSVIDDSYPRYLREHIDRFSYLLYKEPKWYQRLWDRVSVGAIEARRRMLLRGRCGRGGGERG
ncbi:glycosyl transferase GT17 family protein [Lachnoclostridium sp. Marseille-P6806]|uniref:glycosyl transferase GT17 family protein n=1 Tax=Lachnoclostridium sp. Marseille-P6806 TaxID=2364793 RepID=UPI0010318C60|nr:glycosyl transferase GT17 family protein [Lachnoclostridium sp. Marseille-P6806]